MTMNPKSFCKHFSKKLAVHKTPLKFVGCVCKHQHTGQFFNLLAENGLCIKPH
jgi:hypothetical protein